MTTQHRSLQVNRSLQVKLVWNREETRLLWQRESALAKWPGIPESAKWNPSLTSSGPASARLSSENLNLEQSRVAQRFLFGNAERHLANPVSSLSMQGVFSC